MNRAMRTLKSRSDYVILIYICIYIYARMYMSYEKCVNIYKKL